MNYTLMNADILHIFPQPCWHCDALIAGDIGALMELKKAIERAIEHDHSEQEFFVNDGEGYSVKIICVDPKETKIIPVPYTDEEAKAGTDWNQFYERFGEFFRIKSNGQR